MKTCAMTTLAAMFVAAVGAPACGGVNGNETDLDSGGSGDGGPSEDADASADLSDGFFDDTSTDAEAGADGNQSGNVPGRYDHMVTVEGEEREFIVYVPELAAGQVEAPVVFMFHGTSGDGERFYNISGWRERADAEGLIAVFPSALTYCFYEDENEDGDFDDQGERKITTKWVAGKLGDELPLCSAEEIAALPAGRRALSDHPLVDDVAFIDAILDVLATDYVIDEGRIYSSGFSNGGAFSSFLAAQRSTRLAAVAAASGFLDDDIDTPAERPLSMVVSMGQLEDGLTERTGVEALPLDESLLELPVTREIVARYLSLLQLSPEYTFEVSEMSGQRVSRFTFATSNVGADNELQLAVVEGLHHQYPNGTNHPLVITVPLWTFFSQHTLD